LHTTQATLAIHGWFDSKWVGFSGKVCGAAGYWGRRLTLPPFNPRRVRGERCFDLEVDGSVTEKVADRPIHSTQPSSSNLNRFIERFDPGAAFFWFSVDAQAGGRGCVMAYLSTGDGYQTWYAAFETATGCRLATVKGVSRETLEGYAAA
jgi:hypothetical protein